MKIPQLRADLAQHFFYGALIASFVATTFNLLGGQWFGWLLSVVITAQVAALKELDDWWQNRKARQFFETVTMQNGFRPLDERLGQYVPPHEVSWIDFFVTVLGAVAVGLPQAVQFVRFLLLR